VLAGHWLARAAGEDARQAGDADLLAGAEQEGGQRQEQEFGALLLLGQVAVRAPGHARRRIAPEDDGLGGFPLHVPHEDAV
jgi:hypothetical protein